MKNLMRRILKRKRTLTQQEVAILQINDGLKILESHLIAIARLHFIKPETLVREAKNTKDNTEYLKKLVEENKV